MPKRRNGRRGTRKMMPIQSIPINSATSVFVPVGSRIWGVKMEADGKDTYDFGCVHDAWSSSSGALQTYSIKYSGCPNGSFVNLFYDFPFITTKGTAPTANS